MRNERSHLRHMERTATEEITPPLGTAAGRRIIWGHGRRNLFRHPSVDRMVVHRRRSRAVGESIDEWKLGLTYERSRDAFGFLDWEHTLVAGKFLVWIAKCLEGTDLRHFHMCVCSVCSFCQISLAICFGQRQHVAFI